MLTSVIFFFSLIKTHIFHLIQIILVVIILQKCWCFMIHSTYFWGLIQYDLIHHIVNNIAVFLIFLESFPWYEVVHVVLSRLGCSILSPKFPQDFTFIGIISSAVDNTDFRFALRVIYIFFSALSSAPIYLGVSILQGILSSVFPTDYSMVGF